MRLTRRLILGLAAAATLSLPMFHPARAEDKPVLVFAAASLKESLGKVAEALKAESGKAVTLSFAASGPLAKQIEAAAPADVFISADTKWMTYLSDKGLTDKATERPLLGNTLVLIAPKDSATAEVALAEGFDLAGLLGGGRLAIGEVTSVPAGAYGKAALESLKLFDSVKDKLAQGESVRAALALVSRGEAPFGIVYGTDAAADAGVKVVATFPAGSYPAIVYPVAKIASSTHPDAAAFIAYLQSPAAQAVFAAAGFTIPK